jgi:hypothetical protein
VIHGVNAVITAEGEYAMTTSTNENEPTAQATAAAEKPEASKKAHAAPRKPHVAASKAKSANKTTSARKSAKGPKAGNKVTGAREGSKTAQVLNMLNQSGGATLKELMKATGWQRHSVASSPAHWERR